MTVKELVQELSNYDENTEVHFSYNYGDHWHTQVAPKVKNVEEIAVKHSSYHDMDAIADEDEQDEGKLVVVLSS